MESETEKKKEKVPGITSCRVMLAIMGFLGGICIYFMRINMSVAIVCMTIDHQEITGNVTNSTNQNDTTVPDDQCPNSPGSGGDKEQGEFEWSRQLRGNVLSSFFVGYIATQVMGGWLARRFGAKWVIFAGVSLSTVATLLSPVAARGSVYALMVMRAINGLGQGVYFPAFHGLWAQWAPPYERSKLVTFVISGNSWGSVVSFALSGVLCENGFDGGWPSIFYVYGMVASLWCFAWIFLAYSSPAEHPRISDVEREYIEEAIGKNKKQPEKEDLSVPWLSIATSGPFIAIVIGQFCNSWGGYTTLTSLPQYMKDVLRFDIKSNGLYNSLPYICMWVMTVIAAQIVDTLREKKIFSTTVVRKGVQTVGYIFPAAFILATGFLNCHQWEVAIVFLCLAVAFTGCTRSGVITNMMDIAPRYASILMGISNTFATIPGITAPMAVGALTTNGTQDEWKNVFYVCGGLYLFGEIVYMLFASGDVQKWARADVVDITVEEDTKDIEKHAYDNLGNTIKENGYSPSLDAVAVNTQSENSKL